MSCPVCGSPWCPYYTLDDPRDGELGRAFARAITEATRGDRMKVYIVERLVDGPSAQAEEAVLAEYPDALIVHGTRAVGKGLWNSAKAWKEEWPLILPTIDVVVTARRTLALGGLVEVEDAMAAHLPVYTVRGRHLVPVTWLWYKEPECLTRCLGYHHRTRMHRDPNDCGETRHSAKPHPTDRLHSAWTA